MRKLAWFIIGVYAIAMVWALAALLDEGIRTGSAQFLAGILGTGYIILQDGLMALQNTVNSNGTTFIAYSISIAAVGAILFVGVKTFLWDRMRAGSGQPTLKEAGTSSSSIKTTPTGATTRPNVEATPTVPTPTVKEPTEK